ncbi:hypothetical protein MSHI_04510 [Mycobacterium shinjukuense]|uniref:MFS transporter n=1 Tax=Mycobacterium shinjukuense TaxID=398694 RepID=A0A7I7MK69_9MYCO|nr:hypothetical protein MSHI_04510 [Mycobacterium shinjukuense]
MLVAGVGLLWAFVYWQSISDRAPLIPLSIFSDRDFSLCNVGVGITAFATTAMMLPLMFYAQAVCGLSPTRSALLIAPLAITSGVLAPFVGMIVDRSHPLPVLGFGFSVLAISLTWLSIEMAPGTPIWRLVLPLGAAGVGMAFVWSPLAATATRNLPPELAGAGSGVYHATRQLGAVLGSSGLAAFMTSRISAEMPDAAGSPAGRGGSTLQLPELLREPFAAAMSQSVLLPAFITLFGIVAALFLVGIAGSADSRQPGSGDQRQPHDDDDDYVEYLVVREPNGEPRLVADTGPAYREEVDTQPLPTGVRQPASVDLWRPADVALRSEPIGFAHNGSHVDDNRRFRPIGELSGRSDPGNPGGWYGRHPFGP